MSAPSYRPGAVEARTYGASASSTDNTAALQAALTAADGKVLVLPAGATLKITGNTSLTVPPGTTIEGNGATIQAPAGRTVDVLDLEGVFSVTIRDLSITKASGAAVGSQANGIKIRGSCTDILIENVTVDSMMSGIYIGSAGVTAGTERRITLRNVTCNNSPASWGFNLDDCDDVTAINCYGRGNWFDGFKLRRKTLNVRIIGGAFTGNGVSYLSSPIDGAGDGIDAYAGGDTFLIDGTDCSGNYGNGITIKTGDLTESAPSTWGYIRNGQISNVTCRNNSVGSGLYLTLSNPGTTTEPIPSGFVVTGGVFEGNSEYGIYCSGRNVTINHPLVRKNQKHGIVTTSRGYDIEINQPLCVANGQAVSGTYSHIDISSNQTRVNGGRYVGVDLDNDATDAQLAALTPVTKYGINIGTSTTGIHINWPVGRYLTSHTVNDAAGATGGDVIVNQARAGAPNTNGAYGLAGSVYVRTSQGGGTTGHESLWVKTDGTRATPTSGWTYAIPFAPLAALPTATSSNRGLTVRLTGGAGVADVMYRCLKNTSDTYEFKAFSQVDSVDGATGTVSLASTYAAISHSHSLSGGTLTGFGTSASLDTGITSGKVVVVGAGGTIDASIVPSVPATHVFVVASQAAMLALSTAVVGDIAKRTDLGTSFVLQVQPYSTLGNWVVLTDASSVTSVNGASGAVTLTTANISEVTNLYYTTARVNTDAPAVTLNAAVDTIFGLSTQQLTLDTQTANKVFAGPTTGSAAVPTMRALVAGDIPAIAESGVTNLTTDLATHTADILLRALTATAINTTSPLTGGGTLAADRTLAVSDFVASGASHARGTVPDPGVTAGSTKFLREDATWAAPSAGSTPAYYGNVYAAYGNCDPSLALKLACTFSVAATPTAIGTTVARVAYFRPKAAITVNKLRFYGTGVTSGIYQVALYNGDTLARLTSQLSVTTAANAWGSVGTSLGLALTANQLYFIAVSVNTTGTTSGPLCVNETITATAGQIAVLPKSWPGNLGLSAGYVDFGLAQFAVTAGALPTTAATIATQATWTGGMPLFFLDNSNA